MNYYSVKNLKAKAMSIISSGLKSNGEADPVPPLNSNVFIHVGKCGGSTVILGALAEVEWAKDMYKVHIEKPPIRKDLNYYIVARGPISRAVSVFNWRYKMVVDDQTQKTRFAGEYDVLKKYGNINSLAENLYSEEGEPNISVIEEFLRIHHLREDIAFYLGDLLSTIDPNQVKALLMQETLDEDIFRVFGYRNQLREKNNQNYRDDDGGGALSEKGLANLRRYFTKDYECLLKLYCWGKLERKTFISLL